MIEKLFCHFLIRFLEFQGQDQFFAFRFSTYFRHLCISIKSKMWIFMDKLFFPPCTYVRQIAHSMKQGVNNLPYRNNVSRTSLAKQAARLPLYCFRAIISESRRRDLEIVRRRCRRNDSSRLARISGSINHNYVNSGPACAARARSFAYIMCVQTYLYVYLCVYTVRSKSFKTDFSFMNIPVAPSIKIQRYDNLSSS